MKHELTHVNSLIGEQSPYLLQHAHNPVDWNAWGVEALLRAQAEDKPLLVSIGYSSCHWCHVMERESFHDNAIAALMNRNFVCIKIDREERPDLDALYMNAVVAMTGRGGWPLTVFLTPQLKPFFGGTYFPPVSLRGLPGFPQILQTVDRLWRENRQAVERGGEAVLAALQQLETLDRGEENVFDATFLDACRQRFLTSFDSVHGGFGQEPKFPQHSTLLFLLDEHRRSGDPAALAAVEQTLRHMAAGGIHDQLAGGFHRYAVDRAWSLPHFEKMLYDNALLSIVYLRTWQATGREEYAAVSRRTLDFLLRDLQDPFGGFYTALDADSAGEEGAFYVWTQAEIHQHLGPEIAPNFCRVYGITAEGNAGGGRNALFKSCSVAQLAEEEGAPLGALLRQMGDGRATLLAIRSRRCEPTRDRKILTAWNGLAISALALAGAAFEEEAFRQAACRAADRILKDHRLDGRLSRYSMDLCPAGRPFLDDYAYLANGLLDLYTATLRERYLTEARALGREMLDLFSGEKRGDLYFTSTDQQPIGTSPLRTRRMFDEALPSPAAVAWESVHRLAAITGEERFVTASRDLEWRLAEAARPSADASAYALGVASCGLAEPAQIVIVGPADARATRALARIASRRARRGTVLLWASPGAQGKGMRDLSPLVRDKNMEDGQPTAYVCRDGACHPPVTDAKDLGKLLDIN